MVSTEHAVMIQSNATPDSVRLDNAHGTVLVTCLHPIGYRMASFRLQVSDVGRHHSSNFSDHHLMSSIWNSGFLRRLSWLLRTSYRSIGDCISISKYSSFSKESLIYKPGRASALDVCPSFSDAILAKDLCSVPS